MSCVFKGTLDVKYTIVAQNDVPEIFFSLAHTKCGFLVRKSTNGSPLFTC